MPPSQQSAEYIAARSGANDANAAGIVASLGPQQLSFLQCVGSALSTAAGGAVQATWLPAWAAQAAAPQIASGTWGALPPHAGMSADAWMPRCRAAVSALGALGTAEQVQLPLGIAVDMLQKSVSHAQHNIAVLRCVVALVTALARQPHVPLDQHLHRLLPAVLTVLLSAPALSSPQQADEAFTMKDAAARLISLLLQRYGDVYASLRPRLEAVLKRPLGALRTAPVGSTGAGQATAGARLGSMNETADPSAASEHATPPVLVLYGAVQAMCALGSASIRAEVMPVHKQLQQAAQAPEVGQEGPMQHAIAEYSAAMLTFALRCAQAAAEGKEWVERPEVPVAPAHPPPQMPTADAVSSSMSLYASHAAAASTAPAITSQAPLFNASGSIAASASSQAPLLNASGSAAAEAPVQPSTAAVATAEITAASAQAATDVTSGTVSEAAADTVTPAATAAAATEEQDDEEDVEFAL